MRVIGTAEQLTRGNIYQSINIAASGLTAQRRRMDAISSNIANISTTNVDGAGNPYLRQHVVMSAGDSRTFQGALREASTRLVRTDPAHLESTVSYRGGGSGQSVATELVEVPNMRMNVIYDPNHPDADPEGFVVMPDINILEEMVDLMVASRAYDANITVIDAAKSMISRALEI